MINGRYVLGIIFKCVLGSDALIAFSLGLSTIYYVYVVWVCVSGLVSSILGSALCDMLVHKL